MSATEDRGANTPTKVLPKTGGHPFCLRCGTQGVTPPPSTVEDSTPHLRVPSRKVSKASTQPSELLESSLSEEISPVSSSKKRNSAEEEEERPTQVSNENEDEEQQEEDYYHITEKEYVSVEERVRRLNEAHEQRFQEVYGHKARKGIARRPRVLVRNRYGTVQGVRSICDGAAPEQQEEGNAVPLAITERVEEEPRGASESLTSTQQTHSGLSTPDEKQRSTGSGTTGVDRSRSDSPVHVSTHPKLDIDLDD